MSLLQKPGVVVLDMYDHAVVTITVSGIEVEDLLVLNRDLGKPIFVTMRTNHGTTEVRITDGVIREERFVNQNNSVVIFRDEDNALHSDVGPAYYSYSPGHRYEERWHIHGMLKRPDGGPHTTHVAHPQGSAREEYGKWLERMEAHPSLAGLLPKTQVVDSYSERSYDWDETKAVEDGVYSTRVDTNAVAFHQLTSRGVRKTLVSEQTVFRWGKEGQFHRTDGPAYIRYHWFRDIAYQGRNSYDFVAIHTGWYFHGKEIPLGDILKWAKRVGIRLQLDGQLHERSVFEKEEDAFFFVTDFLNRIAV